MAEIHIRDDKMDEFLDLARRCGLTDFEGLDAVFEYSLSLLKLAVEATENGKCLGSFDFENQEIKIFKLPVTDKIIERQMAINPQLKVVK